MNAVNKQRYLCAHNLACTSEYDYMNAASKSRLLLGYVALLCAGILSACGGSYGTGMSGSGMCGGSYGGSCMPSNGPTNSGGPIPVTLSATQLFPQPATTATGTGNFTLDTASSTITGSITLTGVTPTSAELGDAYAGSASAAIIMLTEDATNPNSWDVPAGTTLSAQQATDLAAGKIYVLVRSENNPNGELRAQLLPAGIVVKFAVLTGSAEVPAVATTATGQIAVTVDGANLRAAAHINIAGLTATGAELATGAPGAVGAQLATLVVDATNPNHYLNEAITLTSADLANFTNGMWYGNVLSAAHPTGELRGQIATAAGSAPTLTQVQADIFTPICSVCHTGIGASLPGIQNLTAGNSYASIVNVNSIEEPALKRIAPGDPDNSYLILKIQGSPGIVGVQMPASGGPLTQAQIDEVRAWVAAGALNN
jgi:mono/diheme cytochrome c family protein